MVPRALPLMGREYTRGEKPMATSGRAKKSPAPRSRDFEKVAREGVEPTTERI
jgi:hypothetical protein